MEGEPSDSAQAEKRWCEFERFLSGAPSNIVETENGCRASAKQAFFIPSNIVETENGCRASARQAFSYHRILSRSKMDVGVHVSKGVPFTELMFPVEYNVDSDGNRLLQENTVETIVLISRNSE